MVYIFTFLGKKEKKTVHQEPIQEPTIETIETDIEIEYAENKLTVKGSIATDDTVEFVHRGIANRDFTRTFALNDEVEVKNANLRNGLLTIELERIVPEHKKPKKISIGTIPTIRAQKKELLTEKEAAFMKLIFDNANVLTEDGFSFNKFQAENISEQLNIIVEK
jgi:hypothetical protein